MTIALLGTGFVLGIGATWMIIAALMMFGCIEIGEVNASNYIGGNSNDSDDIDVIDLDEQKE